MAGVTIGKFAAAEGVSVETVRFYQRELLGPVQARSTDEVQRAAEAKLVAVTEQIAELNELACKLRRLVRVCAHGDSDDCLTLSWQTSACGSSPAIRKGTE